MHGQHVLTLAGMVSQSAAFSVQGVLERIVIGESVHQSRFPAMAQIVAYGKAHRGQLAT